MGNYGLTGEGAVCLLYHYIADDTGYLPELPKTEENMESAVLGLAEAAIACVSVCSGKLNIATNFDKVTLHMADAAISAYCGGLRTVSTVLKMALRTNRDILTDAMKMQHVITVIAPIIKGMHLDDERAQVVYRVGNDYFAGMNNGKPVFGDFNSALIAQTKPMRFVIEGTLDCAKLPYTVEEAYHEGEHDVLNPASDVSPMRGEQRESGRESRRTSTSPTSRRSGGGSGGSISRMRLG